VSAVDGKSVARQEADMAERVFRDRREAGRVLAGLLGEYRDATDIIVLGLARGGVPVAYEVARTLGAQLDVFVVRKLGAPGRAELAMGAIASGDLADDDIVRGLRITPDDIRQETWGFAAAFGAGETCEREVVDQLADLHRHAVGYARRDGTHRARRGCRRRSPANEDPQVARAARAAAMAWANIRPAPLPVPVLPAHSRIPAIRGADCAVLIPISRPWPVQHRPSRGRRGSRLCARPAPGRLRRSPTAGWWIPAARRPWSRDVCAVRPRCRALWGQFEQGAQRGVRDELPLHGEVGPAGAETAELFIQVSRRLVGCVVSGMACKITRM
jgi:hypothetical protein